MATTLFITRKQLVQNTILDGNVDTDKFIHFIKIAHEIHIRNFLGTDLYNAIVTKINAGNLTGAYLTLTTTYVQPMLIHYAMADYLPFAAYQIKNGGVFKHTSENAESVTKTEVDYLVNMIAYVGPGIGHRCSTDVPWDLSNNEEANYVLES